MAEPVLTPQHKARIAALKQQGVCAELSPDGTHICLRQPHTDPHEWPGEKGVEKHLLLDDRSCSCGESFVGRLPYEYVDHALDALRTAVEELSDKLAATQPADRHAECERGGP